MLLLAAQVGANLLLWVPLPLASLWVASQLEYESDSLLLGVVAGFALLLAGVRAGVGLVHRIDDAWLDVGPAAWREAALGWITTTCAVVGGGGFAVWLVLIGGMQSSLFPSN
jgi:hypothetical protein